MTSLRDPQQILYRQDVLRDCVANAATVRALYDIAVEAIQIEKKSYFGSFSRYPPAILRSARELMEAFIAVLVKLRNVADRSAGEFKSEGFRVFFAMIQRELTGEYFKTLAEHLKELRFRNGTLISAGLGKGNKGISYVLHMPNEPERNLLKRFFVRKPPSLTFHIAERDEAGARALSELEARGINLVADAVAQSADHILSVFRMLRTELGFYGARQLTRPAIIVVARADILVYMNAPVCVSFGALIQQDRLQFYIRPFCGLIRRWPR